MGDNRHRRATGSGHLAGLEDATQHRPHTQRREVAVRDQQSERPLGAIALPDDVIERTRELYVDAYQRITAEPFQAWLERSV